MQKSDRFVKLKNVKVTKFINISRVDSKDIQSWEISWYSTVKNSIYASKYDQVQVESPQVHRLSQIRLIGRWMRALKFTKLIIKFDHAIPNNIGHFSDRRDATRRVECLRDTPSSGKIRAWRLFVHSRGRTAAIDISSRYYDATARYYACFRATSQCANPEVNVTTGVAAYSAVITTRTLARLIMPGMHRIYRYNWIWCAFADVETKRHKNIVFTISRDWSDVGV